MLSKEEIENGKAHLRWLLDNGILTSEDDSYVEAVLEYIEQLESEKQKLIEKLEEDKMKEFDDCVIYLLEAYLKILKGGKLMSKADKMFEKLGYKKVRDNIDCWCNYENKEKKVTVNFEKNEKMYLVEKEIYDENTEEYILTSYFISTELHQAINEKVKELGWLDE